MDRTWPTAARLRPALFALVAVLLCVEGVLFARQAGPVLHRLADLDLQWLALAVVANTGSMAAFAMLQRIMLRAAGAQLSLRQALLMAYAGNAIALTLPGGSVAGTAYTYRRLRRWGASVPGIAWGLTAAGVLSSIAFTVIAGLGATLFDEDDTAGLVQAAGELLVALLLVLGGRWLYGHPAAVSRLLYRASSHVARVMHRPSVTAVPQRVERAVDAFLAIRPDAGAWGVGAAAALANWLLDLVSLAAAAEGVVTGHVGVGTLLLAYAAGAAAGSLPLLPAGAGTVDGALVAVFTARGVPTDQALAVVVCYRAVTVALLAALGWGAVFVLHTEDGPTAARSGREGDAEVISTDEQQKLAVDRGDTTAVEEQFPG